MKIKIAFVDKDAGYTERIKLKIRKDYSDDLEASYYSDIKIFVDNYEKKTPDVAVINMEFADNSDIAKLPCGILYLSEDNSEGKIGGFEVVGKYQRFDDIYRRIMSVYSDVAEHVSGFTATVTGGSKKVIAFTTPVGGSGSSTMAIACAERIAKNGKGVIYLNFEKIANYYYVKKQGGFDDLFFVMRDNLGKLTLKMESMARRSDSGVLYLPSVLNSLDLCSMKTEDIANLIKAASAMESVQYVVVDLDFAMEPSMYQLLNNVHVIVVTTDGSETANSKIDKYINCLDILRDEYPMISKCRLLYNRFSAGSYCEQLATSVPTIGVVSRYKAAESSIIGAISETNVFDSLM